MPKYNSTNPRPLPPVEYLHERLDYDPETGALTWKQGEWAKRQQRLIGKPAGSRWDRYIRVTLSGDGRYPAHRVIWKWMTGEDPPSDIDHKDRDGFNNRWINLRLADRTQAMWNRKLPRQISPYRGIHRQGKKWAALIRIDNTHRHLGSFSTPEEASAAYELAAESLHGEFYSR